MVTCLSRSAKEFGIDLNLSQWTVETHRARLLEKFQAQKLAELGSESSGIPL